MGRVKKERTSFEARAFIFFLKAATVAFALALPLLGAWTASSLAAYGNGPRWLAIVAGLLGFPILPLAWEGWAQYRRKKAVYAKPHILTFADRLWLRTLALNILFAGGLLGLKPEAGVRALQARGDWMLDGKSGGFADGTRRFLHKTADAFDWIYRAAHDNPYDDDDNGTKTAKKTTKDDKEPPPVRRGDSVEVKADDTSAHDQNGGTPEKKPDEKLPPSPPPKPEDVIPTAAKVWPTADTPLDFAVSVPADVDTSPAAVAHYLKDKAPDELTRARALHDYIADRTAYDVYSFTHRSERAPQDAQTVYTRKMGVCEGYARLFVAMAKEAGLEGAYVIGDARGAGGEVDGNGHAWNAVKANGTWYLVDATWDAGYLEGGAFKKKYTSEYFLTPAEVFGVDHFPRDGNWQLRKPLLSRGEFMRAPQMRPRFYASGLTLVSPDRSQITVTGSADLEVKKADGATTFMLADWESNGTRKRCNVTDGPSVRIHCDFPSAGTYRVLLFQSQRRFGTYDFGGEVVALDAR
jgi:transglutaminase-like putative cysteine protease